MPVALAKVQKKIRKKKGGALNNLGDRDVKRVTSAALRENKLKRQAALRSTARTEQSTNHPPPIVAGRQLEHGRLHFIQLCVPFSSKSRARTPPNPSPKTKSGNFAQSQYPAPLPPLRLFRILQLLSTRLR